ncbi:unnamed protein product [Chilo suppressalis]|uniref:Uncharacterized protein n=1 Tax=Chilo suppressalis TaxID=168631 RepID=A0ABN8B5W7_CHISP|nr:unnamed protein product [Chilo suppressalis]
MNCISGKITAPAWTIPSPYIRVVFRRLRPRLHTRVIKNIIFVPLGSHPSKGLDPDDVPTFVAKELHKLPPVTFDHVDVTRSLKDINFLKANLADVVNKSPEASNVNTRRGAHNASVGSLESKGFHHGEEEEEEAHSSQSVRCAPIGLNKLLRPAIPVTLLYVSRLYYTTKAEGIAEYLRTKTNFSLRAARLESRHDVNLYSFVVRVPTEHLATFLKKELWPKGVVFRRFKGRLPDTTPHHTSPTKRVI